MVAAKSWSAPSLRSATRPSPMTAVRPWRCCVAGPTKPFLIFLPDSTPRLAPPKPPARASTRSTPHPRIAATRSDLPPSMRPPHDAYGAGGQNYRNACAQYDQFDSILSCQQHNPEAQAAIQRAGRRQVDAFMAQFAPEQRQQAYFAPPPQAPIAGPVYGAEPEWQIHARWCLTDGGAGGQNYRNACTQFDQFDSILSCQQHNSEAQDALRRAGRRQVNAFMAQFAPGQCR